MGGYEGLVKKLDEFIRKYYKNQMLKGALYSLGLIVAFFLLVTVLESLGRFGTGVRTLLFWSFVLCSLAVLAKWLFLPLSKLLRLGKVISYEQASSIVGNHFPDVKDKLLNTLQLKKMANNSASDELLEASIAQKTQELSPVPFSSAVQFGENKKYLKYVLPPLAIFLLLFFIAPKTVTESTDRLINHSKEIIPVAPYQIEVLNKDLETPEKEDFTLGVQLSGEEIPNQLFIEVKGTRFPFRSEGKTKFEYVFRNVQKDTPFRIYGNGFYSEEYTLKKLSKPLLINFLVTLDYPAYLGVEDEELNNFGDLNVPEGTTIFWDFETLNTENVEMKISNEKLDLPRRENHFTHQFKALKNTAYTLHTENQFMRSRDSMTYTINVIPDLHPSISVQEERDSLSYTDLFFTGEVKDDYGFKRLQFKYTEKEGNTKVVDLEVPKSSSGQFFHHWELDALGIEPGAELSYYFEVWDNDGINGSKSTRTKIQQFKAPTEEELEAAQEQKNEDIKDKIEKSIDDAQELQKEMEDLRKDLLDKKEMGWEEKKKLEDLLKAQEKLQEQVEELQKENKQKDEQNSQMQQENEEIKQKQEQLQKLFDEVMSDEMKELFKELEKLMEEMNKDEIQEQLEQMNMDNQDLEQELDRALEQFKQLEFDMKMENTIEKMKELAEKQEELAKESEKGEKDSEELKKEQDELNEEFEELKEELEELEKMNEELEDPNAMPDTKEEQESIKEDMEKSSEQLDKGKKSKAGESQQDAAEKMEQMAQQMEMAMDQQEQESQEEDMEALRALLENIITLSFDEEQLMADLQAIDKNDPKYIDYGQVQRKLKTDAKMVEDSLFALSKRVVQIQAMVNREIGLVNDHMQKALDGIADRKTPEVLSNQQYVMTSFNNLALLLDEALQQMQQQMSCKKPGKGNCEKPGGNGAPKPSAGDIKKMQQGLSKQLDALKKKMGKDANKGESKGQEGMSKELAQQAAKQAAIRQMLQKMGQELNKDGSGNGNELQKIAEEMEQIERDIVNQNISPETLMRQQDILVRLLKAEEAERTRGEDDKRKSESGDQNLQSVPMRYSEYQLKKQRELEMLKTVPPSLKPYYRGKVNEYFNNLER
jgi:hypothetical protein